MPHPPRTRWVPALLLLLASAAAVTACTQRPDPGPELHITATIFPVASWTEAVAGERATVGVMVPADVDPHYWEATPDAITRMEASDAFIYVDTDYEFWLDGMLQDWETTGGGPARLGLLAHVDPLPWDADEHHHPNDHGHDDHDDAHEDDHHHGELDPHFTTDPLRAVMAVEAIRDFLSEVDPDGAETYAANAAAYMAELTTLHESFAAGLEACQHRHFITAHGAFTYLAARYGLENVAILGVMPEAEPTPGHLAEVIGLAGDHGLAYIFFETGLSPAASETVAAAVGADLLLLHPLETVTPQDLAGGATYLSLMEQNLNHLRLALGCP